MLVIGGAAAVLDVLTRKPDLRDPVTEGHLAGVGVAFPAGTPLPGEHPFPLIDIDPVDGRAFPREHQPPQAGLLVVAALRACPMW